MKKEAKEYAIENYENCIYADLLYTDDSKAIEQSFKEGAEFGYNKANEWHKQDLNYLYTLISKSQTARYFICIMKDKNRVMAIGNCDESCNGEVNVKWLFEHNDDKYDMDDIV